MPERLLIIFFIAIRTLNFGSAQEKFPRALGKIFSLPRPQKIILFLTLQRYEHFRPIANFCFKTSS